MKDFRVLGVYIEIPLFLGNYQVAQLFPVKQLKCIDHFVGPGFNYN